MSAARMVGSMLPSSTSSGLYAAGILFKQKNDILTFKAEQKCLQIRVYAAAVTGQSEREREMEGYRDVRTRKMYLFEIKTNS